MGWFKYRIHVVLIIGSLTALLAAGCSQQTAGDDLNNSMNARQKAVIKEHKQKQEE